MIRISYCAVELMNRTNSLLGRLLSMEKNGISFQKEYQRDHIIKSDNGMFSAPLHLALRISPILPGEVTLLADGRSITQSFPRCILISSRAL